MKDEKDEIVEAGKEIYERGLVAGTWGNISRRLEEEPGKFLITPSGIDYREIEPEDLVLLNLNGDKIEGEKEPSTERPLHSLILSSREEIDAIVHTHSSFASAVSCLRHDIPPILEDMVQIIGGRIKTAKYELPGTKDLAKSALEGLQDRKAVLLANHGAVALGESMEEALKVAEIIEKSAKVYLMAELVGAPKEISEEDMEYLRDLYENYTQD